jgi:DNA-binding LacI/PurR family transcriptional regulator
MLSPRPATIDLGTDQIGRWAVTRLVNRIARPSEPPIRMLIAPKLVASPTSSEMNTSSASIG